MSGLATLSISDNELRAEFEKLDINNDGKISIEEFKHAFKTLLDQSLTFVELQELISHFDTNEDGEIDFEEFKEMIAHFQNNPMTNVVLL